HPPDAGFSGWIADEVTEEDELEWQVVLGRLLALQPNRPEGASEHPKPIPFSADGQRAFAAWCDALAAEANGENFPPELRGVCSKLRAYAARFALVLRLLRS